MHIIRGLLSTLSAWLLLLSTLAYGTECADVFPDGAVTQSPRGTVQIGLNSKIINNPDTSLATHKLSDYSEPGTSCDTAACTADGTAAATISYNDFPRSSTNVVLGYRESRTLSPGYYNNLDVGNEAVLTLQPGDYVFSGYFTKQHLGQINIAPAGNVSVFVQGEISIAAGNVNTSSPSPLLFYTKASFYSYSDSNVNALVYSLGELNLHSKAVLTGAGSAGVALNLYGATIVYDAQTAATAFSNVCTTYVPATDTPIGYWSLDELSWSGMAGEVKDSSQSGFHGRAIDLNGLPATQATNPAIAGNPGTCRAGEFNGVNDGYLQIDDPGTNSAFDVGEYTVSAWFFAKALPTSDLMTIASKDAHWEIHVNPKGQIYWYWGGSSRDLLSPSVVTPHNWYHLAITFGSGEQKIYLNGSLITSATSRKGALFNNMPIYIGTDFELPSRRFNGYIDEVRYYGLPLAAGDIAKLASATHACASEVRLSEITISPTPANGSTCSPSAVEVGVRDSNGNLLTGYTGSVALSTSTGNGTWSLTGQASDAAGTLESGGDDSGTATYTFAQDGSDQGTVRLWLANNHAETLQVKAVSGDIVGASPAMLFSANAFRIVVTDSLGSDNIAGRAHGYRMEMVRQDPQTGTCAIASDYSLNEAKIWIERQPGDPGAPAPSLLRNGTGTTLPDAQPASANVALTMQAGTADVALLGSDVGYYTLHILDDTTNYSDQVIGGDSGALTTRPFAFEVSVVSNPAATGATGNPFSEAGAAFSVSARAVVWEAADDLDGDGIADGHNDDDPGNNADLSNNGAAAYFGRETDPVGARLTAKLVAPIGGADPGLGSAVAAPDDGRVLTQFANGQATTSEVFYGEVGIVELASKIDQAAYIGATIESSQRIIGRSGYVGRFIPSRLNPTQATLSEACSSTQNFTYMSQPFSVEWNLEALNKQEVITKNYEGDFAKLGPGVGTVATGASDEATSLTSRLTSTLSEASWTGGEGTLINQITLSRGAMPEPPLWQIAVGIAATDADGVQLAGSLVQMDWNNDSVPDAWQVGTTNQLFGRLKLADAHGPETADLPVLFQTQYWDGTLWEPSSYDDCTALTLSSIAYPDGTIDIITNRTITVGQGTTTGHYQNVTPSHVQFSAGDAGHYFSAPGKGNTGSFEVKINLADYPWLRFDWNGDGDHGDASIPTHNYIFGMHRGHDQIIYWHEVLN